MGRLFFLIIVVAAIVAGVWFLAPGGKELIRSWIPGSEACAIRTPDGHCESEFGESVAPLTECDTTPGACEEDENREGDISSEDGVDVISPPASDDSDEDPE